MGKGEFMPLLEVVQFEDGCMSKSQVSMPSCPYITYVMLNLFMCLTCRGCMAQEGTHGRRPAAASAVQHSRHDQNHSKQQIGSNGNEAAAEASGYRYGTGQGEFQVKVSAINSCNRW